MGENRPMVIKNLQKIQRQTGENRPMHALAQPQNAMANRRWRLRLYADWNWRAVSVTGLEIA